MQASLAREGAHVDRFHGEAGFASGARGSRGSAGTPDPFAEAMAEWPIVREKSFFIGVERGDIEAARGAGLAAHLSDGGDLARIVEGLLARSAQG